MSQVSFTAKIEKTPHVGGWHYVRIPDDAHTSLRTVSSKSGNVPVLVTIGNSTWPSTTMSMGQQRWFVAVKADVRKAEGLSEGNAVSVNITPDFDRLKP